jgi:hypothetical protein
VRLKEDVFLWFMDESDAKYRDAEEYSKPNLPISQMRFAGGPTLEEWCGGRSDVKGQYTMIC